MVLVKVGVQPTGAPRVGDHHCSVQPLVGVQWNRQHSAGVTAVENMLVDFRAVLVPVDLADVGYSWQPLSSVFIRSIQVENLGVVRRLAHGSPGQVNGRFHRS